MEWYSWPFLGILAFALALAQISYGLQVLTWALCGKLPVDDVWVSKEWRTILIILQKSCRCENLCFFVSHGFLNVPISAFMYQSFKCTSHAIKFPYLLNPNMWTSSFSGVICPIWKRDSSSRLFHRSVKRTDAWKAVTCGDGMLSLPRYNKWEWAWMGVLLSLSESRATVCCTVGIQLSVVLFLLRWERSWVGKGHLLVSNSSCCQSILPFELQKNSEHCGSLLWDSSSC